MERISAQDGVDGRLALRSREANGEALPSRTKARASIRASIEAVNGIWVLSGDAGVGKTWTWRGLAQGSESRSWLTIDVPPGLTGEGLYEQAVHLLGLPSSRPARVTLQEWLETRALDGDKTVLVLEECQNADATLLEEIRVLGNQIGLGQGFASIGLVGQTYLLRRLNTRAFWPFASRISTRVHLRSLDTDEVGLYLALIQPGQKWTSAQVEGWQVATAGNPRLIRQRLATIEPRTVQSQTTTTTEPKPAVIEAPVERAPSMLGPSRPPIRLEEGVIEVGWSPEGETKSSDTDESELAINDRYAALQAWNEWSKAQTVQAPPPPKSPPVLVPVTVPAEEADDLPSPEPPWVRADDHHEHSPFSPMFTRLKRATDAE